MKNSRLEAMAMTTEPHLRTRVLVHEVMNSPVISVGLEETASRVAETMAAQRVGSVVVMDGKAPVGIVTEGDLAEKVVARDLKPSRIKVAQIMSKPLHTIEGERDITEAAKLMRSLRVKRLGVTHRGELVGIISVSDILSITPELVEVLSEKARLARGESLRTRGFVSGYCDGCSRWSDLLLEVDNRFLCEDCREGGAESEA